MFQKLQNKKSIRHYNQGFANITATLHIGINQNKPIYAENNAICGNKACNYIFGRKRIATKQHIIRNTKVLHYPTFNSTKYELKSCLPQVQIACNVNDDRIIKLPTAVT